MRVLDEAMPQGSLQMQRMCCLGPGLIRHASGELCGLLRERVVLRVGYEGAGQTLEGFGQQGRDQRVLEVFTLRPVFRSIDLGAPIQLIQPLGRIVSRLLGSLRQEPEPWVEEDLNGDLGPLLIPSLEATSHGQGRATGIARHSKACRNTPQAPFRCPGDRGVRVVQGRRIASLWRPPVIHCEDGHMSQRCECTEDPIMRVEVSCDKSLAMEVDQDRQALLGAKATHRHLQVVGSRGDHVLGGHGLMVALGGAAQEPAGHGRVWGHIAEEGRAEVVSVKPCALARRHHLQLQAPHPVFDCARTLVNVLQHLR
mmetsp:Transcript_62016/g.133393  ORF Transcript_62016/g.133393 Transcript_62016/m.133393 type:complete len:312 (+) Transcript_62016:162-1097(+)